MSFIVESLIGCLICASCSSDICRSSYSRDKRSDISLLDRDCSICLEKITGEYKKLKCGHKYHIYCYDSWNIKKTDITCPNCGK